MPSDSSLYIYICLSFFKDRKALLSMRIHHQSMYFAILGMVLLYGDDYIAELLKQHNLDMFH